MRPDVTQAVNLARVDHEPEVVAGSDCRGEERIDDADAFAGAHIDGSALFVDEDVVAGIQDLVAARHGFDGEMDRVAEFGLRVDRAEGVEGIGGDATFVCGHAFSFTSRFVEHRDEHAAHPSLVRSPRVHLRECCRTVCLHSIP